MLTIPIKLASLLVLVNGSLLFLAGICMSAPAAAQTRELEQAGQLQQLGKVTTLAVDAGDLVIPVSLPSQAVSLIKLEF